MLLLTIIVGCGIFFPVPDNYFYQYCIAIEILVLVGAEALNCAASRLVVWLSMSLICLHVMGLQLDGYPEESPYHALVVSCEYAEILACILFSRFASRTRHHV